MKKLFLFQISLMLCIISVAQKPTYEWAGALGGGSKTICWGNSVAVDNSGNVYTTGMFMDKVDFDPDATATSYLSSNGGADIYISKLDKDGKFVWAINIGDASDDEGKSINLDANGDIYVTGYFQDNVDFDPSSGTTTLSSAGGMDVFVCKFDSKGNFVWASAMGSAKGDDAGNGIDVDGKGNVYVTGFFNETADFDPSGKGTANLTSFGASDIFVSYLDNGGNYVWAGQMGGSGDDVGNAIALDSLNRYVHTTGYFNGTADFDPSPKATVNLTVVNDADIFVSKLDIQGNYTWAVKTGFKEYDEGKGIAVDGLGNIYSTGYFYGTADFDPAEPVKGNQHIVNLTSAGDADIYVWKLDATGAIVWAKNMGGSATDKGFSIALDGDKNVYIAGIFEDVADFDPSATSSQTLTAVGYSDAFNAKYDVSGTYDIAYATGDADIEEGNSIAVDKLKSIYTTGAFMATVDFNPGKATNSITASGFMDAFVLKLSMCKADLQDVTAKACNSYTYNGNTYFKSGNYNNTFKNITGCDSIVTLKLTLNSDIFYQIDARACNSYTINGQTYTKEDIYVQKLKRTNGCDSFLTIDLKFLTSSGTDKVKACNSVTVNGQTFTKEGTNTYTQMLTNKAGCDSTLNLTVTIVKSSVSNPNPKVTACNSYKLFGTTYDKSGTFVQVEKNVAGCDSTITLNLTINNSKTENMVKTACSSYILNGTTYDKTGIYTQKRMTTKGCDSTIVLDLAINNSSSKVTSIGCQNYIYHGNTYTASGVYDVIIPNAKGCDSAVKLTLTVNKVITAVTQFNGTLSSDAIGVDYQWLDCNNGNSNINGEIEQSFTPKVTGDYAVRVTKGTCSDVSTCYNVKVGKVTNTSGNSIRVFPNPTNGETNILSGNSLKNGTIKLISITGQTLFVKNNLTGNSFSLNLSDEAKGIYFVEISEGGNVSRVKLVKN